VVNADESANGRRAVCIQRKGDKVSIEASADATFFVSERHRSTSRSWGMGLSS
jgi:hypothetical protein